MKIDSVYILLHKWLCFLDILSHITHAASRNNIQVLFCHTFYDEKDIFRIIPVFQCYRGDIDGYIRMER